MFRRSIAGQASITTSSPAALARAAASSSMTPTWSQTAFAPISMAWSTIAPTLVEFTKQSTTSMVPGIWSSRV